MTFQPPPPPPGQPDPNQPYGAPPPPPPPPAAPPAQQYSAPPPAAPQPGYPTPSAGFNASAVNPLDWGILAAGFLAFIFSFVSWYSFTAKIAGFTSATVHENAWHGFFGLLAVLLALIGSALVAVELFAPTVSLPFPARLVGLGLYAVATLFMLLTLFIVPDYHGYSGPGIDKGHSFGYWISLIVIIAGLVMSLMRFQAKGGKLPGALGSIPNIGGHGPQ
jgi:hypothetical protein